MLEPSPESVTTDADRPALPEGVQRHLGHLLAAAYAQDAIEPSVPERFAELLARLEAGFGQAQGGKDAEFQRALLAIVPSLQRFAWSLLRNHVGTDDLLQNTLLR